MVLGFHLLMRLNEQEIAYLFSKLKLLGVGKILEVRTSSSLFNNTNQLFFIVSLRECKKPDRLHLVNFDKRFDGTWSKGYLLRITEFKNINIFKLSPPLTLQLATAYNEQISTR